MQDGEGCSIVKDGREVTPTTSPLLFNVGKGSSSGKKHKKPPRRSLKIHHQAEQETLILGRGEKRKELAEGVEQPNDVGDAGYGKRPKIDDIMDESYGSLRVVEVGCIQPREGQ